MEEKMVLINDRYELIRIIGKGGFGTTWYARDTKLDMPVAVKELSDTDPSRKKKFLREARTLARFAREPGIVNVRDYLEYNGRAYMVMEYLDGSDLNTKIADGGPISFKKAYYLLRPVILVLSKLHEEGVIHRDVSPDNIRMQNDGTIKLLDFGAAWNSASPENATTTITVKPGYAPYEQYAGKEQQGPFTDVYAVCATLYKCITGVTPPEALKRAFYDEMKVPSLLGAQITPDEEKILLKGLAVLPSDRIRSMDALQQLFDEAVGEKAPDADSAHNDPVEKTVSEGSSGSNDSSTLGYEPDNYKAQNQSAQVQPEQQYAAASYAASGYAAQDRSVSGFTEKRETRSAGSPSADAGKTGRGSAPVSTEKAVRREKSADSGNIRKQHVRKPKKALIALIALIVAAVGVVFFIFRGAGSRPYRETSNEKAVILEKTTVTAEKLQAIEKNANIKNLTLDRCELSDAAVEEISRLTYLENLRISQCTGFTTLDPLADAPALMNLSILYQIRSELDERSANLDGSTLFTRDFPNILELSISGSIIDGGTDCLGHFPNLERISLSLLEPYSIACIDKMPKLRNIRLIDSDPSENDYLNLSGEEAKHLYGHPQLESLTAEDSNLSDLRISPV